MISHKKFGEIRILELKNETFFVANDVAKALKFAKPNNAISTHCRVAFKHPCWISGKFQEVNFIDKNNVSVLIQKAKTKDILYKNEFKDWLVSSSYLNDVVIIETREETEFIKDLEDFLKGIGIKCGITQYKVLDYRIDYYIPDFKIAIEYDENDHIGYSYEAQELRQKRIEEELKCKFIRLSDSNSNTYNIGMIARELIA